MTSGDGPEIWIDNGTGSGGGPGPDGSRGPGSGSGRGRWIALAAGFALLLALIGVQHYASGPGGDASTTVITSPSTSSSTTRASAPTTSSLQPTITDQPSSTSLADTTEAIATMYSTSAITTPSADPAPTTVTTGVMPLSGAPFELVGLRWNGILGTGATVVRYRPDTGVTVSTDIPAPLSNGPFSFVVTAGATIFRPWDHVPAVVAPDGEPAEIAGGAIAQATQALPADRPDRLWVTVPDGDNLRVMLVDDTGRPVGPTITLPASLGIPSANFGLLSPDGDGYALVRAVGGVYDLSPKKVRLVTHGVVMAAGPTGYLVYECDESAQCAAAVVDRATHRHTTLPGDAPAGPAFAGQMQGVISPNGRFAAIAYYAQGPLLLVIDLHTGKSTPVSVSLSSQVPMFGDASVGLVFTPDSRTLLVAADTGVKAVDPVTGAGIGTLPIPPLAAIAVRPVG